MFDSITDANDFLSEHWLAEVFPNRLRELARGWKERAEQEKPTPVRGLSKISGSYLSDLADLPDPVSDDYDDAVERLHAGLLDAVGFDAAPTVLDTSQAETHIEVPLLLRAMSPTDTDSLHILHAVPVESVDALLGDAELIDPIRLHVSSEKVETIASVSEAITQLFISDDPPRYLLVVAGGSVLLTDAARWSEGRYLGFDVATALDRRDEKATGELAYHAGLWSSDALLPDEDGKAGLDRYTEDSEKHAVGVSEDLREGLRISIEKIANEVLSRRRELGLPVEGVPELPRDLTTQSLRFLYRILFLLFAEARPELGVLPVGAPEYEAGYGLDRLRELVQVPLTGRSADGDHLHASLDRLFRLVDTGHNAGREGTDGLVFEPLRSDLFDPAKTPLIDGDDMRIRNVVLQEVLNLLLLSKPSKRKGSQRGYISYAQLGINQLGAVYEGLMSYSGLIAGEDMVEVAKDGNADKGSWLVPSSNSGEYDEKDLVWREDRLTGRKDIVRHEKGSFVFRLSGRDRQRSASYYTPEVLTKCVVKHALAELITDDTTAADILEYRICEPALGSGAFLNEAINQLATEYLNRRQEETGERIKPEEFTTELQKVKAYLALHRAYGVDLNSTAVELAEVSLWLNVMHRGLKAPWFGLHLRRGNSLIGARRATYDFTSLGRAKKSWLKTPPTDRPLSEGAIGNGEIHHFLLPAHGWAAVADAKQAKELVPEDAAALRQWRKEVTKKPNTKQLDRLKALATRIERLWALTLRRLEISEQQISRQIDVWGADLPAVDDAVDRTRVQEELHDPEGPYERLCMAMDAWCALWFWPITGIDEDDVRPEPPSLDEWIVTLEELLGTTGIKKGDKDQGSFTDLAEGFDELAQIDDQDRLFSGMRSIPDLLLRHEWLGVSRTIAQEQGFFHWELAFAQIFERGGFDLQVGNPPWVRPEWDMSSVLAEFDPFFGVVNQKSVDRKLRDERINSLVSSRAVTCALGDGISSTQGMLSFIGSMVMYPELGAAAPNLYRNFMLLSGRNISSYGISGLIHPDDHFTHDKTAELRTYCYFSLRRHFGFINELQLFEEVSHTDRYGLHIYAKCSESSVPNFIHMAGLYHPRTIDESLVHDGAGITPGAQKAWGGWDTSPHLSRVIIVTDNVLAELANLFGDPHNFRSTPFPNLMTEQQLAVLGKLGHFPGRMAGQYFWTRCWDEDKIKSWGIAEWNPVRPKSLDRVVLQPPHFSLANPFAKEPRLENSGADDFAPLDLRAVGAEFVPTTNYRLKDSCDTVDSLIRRWGDAPVNHFWRLVWRRRLGQNMERTLHAALIPPGGVHVHTVHSLICTGRDSSELSPVGNDWMTVLCVGVWSSLLMDFLIKISGSGDLRSGLVDRFPLLRDVLAGQLIVNRSLRLSCLTDDYADIWERLSGPGADDCPTRSLGALVDFVEPGCWNSPSGVRSELSRWALLVEIDVLVAISLGITVDELVGVYRSTFSVLRKYEYFCYFDGMGQRIGIDKFPGSRGVAQVKGDYQNLQAWFEGEDCGDLLDRYTPFPPDADHDEPWFYKPDREAEMRAAYAEFEKRLAQA